jgi:Flp pilus assembly pilin Flp
MRFNGRETEMALWLHDFWLEEEGQDLVEYSLLLTFIAFTCAALVFSGTPYVNGIWIKENANLVSANSTASGS